MEYYFKMKNLEIINNGANKSAIPIIADTDKGLYLPNPLGDTVDNLLDPLAIYMSIRISHVEYSLTRLRDYFFLHYDQVIICQEEATKAGTHFHLLVKIPQSFVLGAENRKLKELLKKDLPLLEKPRTLSCSKVEKVSYISYILKDDHYYYKGFSDDVIATMASKSYKKYDKTVFAKEWDVIRMDKTLSAQRKLMEYIQLKRKYNQTISWNKLDELYLTFSCDSKKEIGLVVDVIHGRYNEHYKEFQPRLIPN